MDAKKLDRLFVEAVRGSGILSEDDLDYAIGFQDYASQEARTFYPFDRIALKFGYLDREQILGLYNAIRYYRWRKEDKFFLKIALQSKLLNQRQANSCLREQKRLYKNDNALRRVNEIARRKAFLTRKQELAILDAMARLPGRSVTIIPARLENDEGERTLQTSQAPRPPSTREIFDEPRASSLESSDDLDSLFPVSDDDVLVDRLPQPVDDELLPRRPRDPFEIDLAADDDDSASSDLPPLKMMSDDDLDPLWDGVEVDDLDLDSDTRHVEASSFADSEEDSHPDDDLF